VGFKELGWSSGTTCSKAGELSPVFRTHIGNAHILVPRYSSNGKEGHKFGYKFFVLKSDVFLLEMSGQESLVHYFQ